LDGRLENCFKRWSKEELTDIFLMPTVVINAFSSFYTKFNKFIINNNSKPGCFSNLEPLFQTSGCHLDKGK